MVAVKKLCGKCGAYSVNEHHDYNGCIADLKRKVFALSGDKDELMQELAEWRAGTRRVFWRVRCGTGRVAYFDFANRLEAFENRDLASNRRVYRVTVEPAKPKEAK